MDVIVELVNRAHKPIERHRYTQAECRIGRAFDNDLILSEPHVSPHHAVLTEDSDGRWWLLDLASTNGIKSRRNKRLEAPLEVISGEEYVLGRVHLKFYHVDHPVADTVGQAASEHLIHALSRPFQFCFFSVLALMAVAGFEYLTTFNGIDPRVFIPAVIQGPFFALVWAAIWALAGRLLRHEPRFVSQFVVTLGYLLATNIADFAVQTVAFNSGSSDVAVALGYGLHGFMMVALLVFNLRLATQQPAWSRLLTAFIVAWSLVGVVWLYSVFNQPTFQSQPDYVGSLKPPYARWKDPMSMEQFMSGAQKLFQPSEEKPD